MWKIFRRRQMPQQKPLDPELFLDDLNEAWLSYAYNAASDAEIKQRMCADFKLVFGSLEGRRVLYWMFSWANMFGPVPDGISLEKTEGKREICYRVLQYLNSRFDERKTTFNDQRAEAESGTAQS